MDRIDILEAKIKDLIGLAQRLRKENEDLRSALSTAEQRIGQLSGEHSLLDQEREVVRQRIEALLGELEGQLDPQAAQPPRNERPRLRAVEAGRPETSQQTLLVNTVLPGTP